VWLVGSHLGFGGIASVNVTGGASVFGTQQINASHVQFYVSPTADGVSNISLTSVESGIGVLADALTFNPSAFDKSQVNRFVLILLQLGQSFRSHRPMDH
jgi:hypothetical protein